MRQETYQRASKGKEEGCELKHLQVVGFFFLNWFSTYL